MRREKEWKYCYCLFCKSGAEIRLKNEIERRQDGIDVLVAEQEKYKYIGHHYEIDRRVFLPGYLFLYANERIDFERILRIEEAYRFLGDTEDTAELQGNDRAFGEWLWMNNGLIGVSRVRTEDGRVKIIDGPMKYFGQSIVKINKHTKNALVRMRFLDQIKEIWLAFEFMDDIIVD